MAELHVDRVELGLAREHALLLAVAAHDLAREQLGVLRVALLREALDVGLDLVARDVEGVDLAVEGALLLLELLLPLADLFLRGRAPQEAADGLHRGARWGGSGEGR